MSVTGGDTKGHAVPAEAANATPPCAPQSIALHAIQTHVDVTLSALAHPHRSAPRRMRFPQGRLQRAWKLFGTDLDTLMGEMNLELVA